MSDAAPPIRLPPPPSGADQRRDWLRLLRSYRVGASTFYRLMDDHGSAAAALAALPEVARSAGVSGYQPCSAEAAQVELNAGKASGARLVACGEADYPAALTTLAEPPPLLWLIGDPSLARRPAVALVGTRQATSLGTRMARGLADELGRAGQVIVSGLARGIDTAAHLGSLATGTIAVLPGGVEKVYPPENAGLAAEIAAQGLRISDQPIGLVPQAHHFARRNRLIAGLAAAVVVVEAPSRSGALITAREALEAGREVMAVPGHPLDSRVSGCNQLIRDGAVLVRSGADVLEVLAAQDSGRGRLLTEAAPRPAAASGRRRADQVGIVDRADSAAGRLRSTVASADSVAEAGSQPARPGELPERILRQLSLSPLSEDQLSRDLGLSAGALGREVSALELDGRIERRPGGLLCRRP